MVRFKRELFSGGSMSLFIEKYYPFFCGILSFAVSFYFLKKYDTSLEVINKLLPSILSLCGVLIGFMSATEALLFAISEQPLVKKMRKIGGYQRTIVYYRHAIRILFVLLILTTCMIAFDLSSQNIVLITSISVWFGLLAVSIASCFRAIDIFSDIVKEMY